MLGFDNIILELSIIFVGSALLATIFLKLKQPVILSYIFLGMLIGPWGFKLINNPAQIEKISHFGIILLLFLLGLDLQPAKLIKLFKKTALITLVSNFFFMGIVFGILQIFGFTALNSAVAGIALMFSSTVICVKLINTNTLHHKYIGEMIISILLIQDILAILSIIIIKSGKLENAILDSLFLILKLIGLILLAYLVVKFLILKIVKKYDTVHEYVFIVSLGWCLLVAEIAKVLGLSYEIGAFIAGVSLAISPLALFILDRLKPLRNFFLVLFFFSIGANYDFLLTRNIILPGIIIVIVLTLIKPMVYYFGFNILREDKKISKELGFRLGQSSEFALIIAYTALQINIITDSTSYLIQFVTITTFIISTFIVMKKYKTPISLK
ncbi:MAG: cation:proton antiporter [Candidatus Mcinerneyibacterium aminivorans]|jgi:Kef-type K+ transport system membrane component KefB|uniref:Cation:proton antiporter n=1 Tax=Candidatus Mcinerneyibacterium aminivorans TaxID=2703815 RepID=A0A5D0MJH2_9BACT|nr:MAG: cation:proton antiporter [Candidatus Mcinerneyibacterium aminivorans]